MSHTGARRNLQSFNSYMSTLITYYLLLRFIGIVRYGRQLDGVPNIVHDRSQGLLPLLLLEEAQREDADILQQHRLREKTGHPLHDTWVQVVASARQHAAAATFEKS